MVPGNPVMDEEPRFKVVVTVQRMRTGTEHSDQCGTYAGAQASLGMIGFLRLSIGLSHV